MELLGQLSPEAARTFTEHRAAIMENPRLDATSSKTKLLIGIGVAAALQSSTCTLMWTRLAHESGVTEQEIAESIAVSRLMKAATVNDTAAVAIDWLLDLRKEGERA